MREAGRAFNGDAVLENINLEVPAGELFGLVGPSGCGKTTLVRLIVGLLAPTSGEVRVGGVEPVAFAPKDRRAIGYLPQEFSLYPTLTVRENARFVAGLYGIGWFGRRRRIRELLEFLELWEARKRAAQHLSGGMRRRLGLACALVHRPSLLVVDEPTAGLDPELRVRIWEHLRAIQEQGATIFLTTQYIEEAERCDAVAILQAGRMAAVGAPDALRREAGIPDRIEVSADGLTVEDIRALWGLDGVREVRRLGPGQVRIFADESERAVAEVGELLAERGRPPSAVNVQDASFEEVFISLVERSRR